MAYGKLKRVENLDQKAGANSAYYRVLVKGEGLETLLITENELADIRHRALQNPEDTDMLPTWWDKVSAAFAGLWG